MRTILLSVVALAAAQQDPRGRRFQPEPTYSPETPFRDNVPAAVFGAGHHRFQPPSLQQAQSPRYWGQEEPSRFQSPWGEQQQGQQPTQQQARPFGNFERAGGGRDSGEEDGPGSAASGGPDGRRPAKVVGVNMQMVAGMYPDGRYSPLSGPYDEDSSSPRNRGGAPFRQGPFRGDPEIGSHPPRGFFGPKPTSRENEHYEPDMRRREYEGRPDRDHRPEEYDRRERKYKPDDDVEEGFRDSDKGRRVYMGDKRPNEAREVAGDQPEDMGRFRNFHKDEDRIRQEEPRRERERSERPEDDRSERPERERDVPRPPPIPTPVSHLVDGEAGARPKNDVLCKAFAHTVEYRFEYDPKKSERPIVEWRYDDMMSPRSSNSQHFDPQQSHSEIRKSPRKYYPRDEEPDPRSTMAANNNGWRNEGYRRVQKAKMEHEIQKFY